jgi:hypothetical protein
MIDDMTRTRRVETGAFWSDQVGLEVRLLEFSTVALYEVRSLDEARIG